jgi:hypothetical protein
MSFKRFGRYSLARQKYRIDPSTHLILRPASVRHATVNRMRTPLVALIIVGALTCSAGDLQGLKAAAGRYVAAMKAILALPKTADCSDTSSEGSKYAAAKTGYYQAARQAMPILLQMVKGEKMDTGYGQDLIELLRGFGEDEDQEATIMLESRLRRCGYSVESLRARTAIEAARQSAERFRNDFRHLQGTEKPSGESG